LELVQEMQLANLHLQKQEKIDQCKYLTLLTYFHAPSSFECLYFTRYVGIITATFEK